MHLAAPAISETKEQKSKRWADLEEKVGTNWFNKAGMAVLILGIAYFLNYVIKTLPAAGKIAVAFTIALVLLAVGVWAERKERYQILGRGSLGGGWALAYFTTYAMHNIQAVKVVESPVAGFLLLFVVAAAMVLHSLRYDSQVVTGLAYLLAFASVAVSTITVGALVASALLAASLVAVLARRKWYVLELPAIVATYTVHWVWLYNLFEDIGGKKKFPEFPASVALLTVYWAIFTVSHFLRKDGEPGERQILTGAFLLNLLGYLAVMRYQSLYPEWRYWFLLGVGLVYLALAAFSQRIGRRLAFVLTSTVGAALVVIAIPYKYSGARLELIWAVEAQALLVAGWRFADRHLRKLGWSALAALAGYVLFHEYSLRNPNWHPPDWPAAWMLFALAVVYFANGYITPRRFAEQAGELDRAAAQMAHGVGTFMLLAAVWLAAPLMWVAVLWCLILLALHEAARRVHDGALRVCGHIAALAAVVRLLVVNLQFAPALWGMSLRVITIGICTALLYGAARRLQITTPDSAGDPPAAAEDASPFFRPGILNWYTWSGTAIFAAMIWNEMASGGVATAWALYGLALLETGRAKDERQLRAQGHALLFLGVARVFFADLNVERAVGPFSARLLTVSVLAAICYYVAMSMEEQSRRLRAAYLWSGMTALLALARFELPTIWVAVGWSALALAVYGIAARLAPRNRPADVLARTLRVQSYVITLLVGIRCAFDNFYQTGDYWFRNARTVTVLAACTLLYVLLAIARRNKDAEAGSQAATPASLFRRVGNRLDANAHQLFYFVPTILLTVLLSLEVKRSYMTAAWGLEAFLAFGVALWLRERAYRWFSLALFLLALIRVAAVDWWTFDQLGRIVSFVGLGAALLTVSFLYARFRDMWRKYM